MKLSFAKVFKKGQFYITVIKDIILIFITMFEMWKINIVYLVTLYVFLMFFKNIDINKETKRSNIQCH